MTLAPPKRPPASPEARRHRFRFDLASEAGAPKIARTVVADLMTLTGNAELVDDMRVLVSELVTNVHLHTETAVVRLDVAVHPRSVCVAVWDDTPRGRLLSLPARIDGGSGRGLFLVEALAARWGVYRTDAGCRFRKGVWFALDRVGTDGP
ncbi:ATP-binding protein [Streptomyces sp. MST-110588]|uniref:ATP-binding protein n=1 Tax=Streptomyces sp. MST-110588 TaxID=2833628 RepID=UPI001F5D5015|nr:ATP-binding protein [Streptomyces sp. MST-110588]UNO39864.1 ATP-binding protein [Streptomyces sp. MST-110588]